MRLDIVKNSCERKRKCFKEKKKINAKLLTNYWREIDNGERTNRLTNVFFFLLLKIVCFVFYVSADAACMYLMDIYEKLKKEKSDPICLDLILQFTLHTLSFILDGLRAMN